MSLPVLPLLPLIASMVYFGFFHSYRTYPIHSAAVSPTGPMAVVVFEAQCDATTGFNTQASLAPSVAEFDHERDPVFLALRGLHAITVRWLDPKTVELTIYHDEAYPADRRVFPQDDHVGDIKVIYK